jgi:[acyl-carrier-protein] S-malonyltransferase
MSVENGAAGVPAGRGLLLRGKLLIGIAPRADLQTAANPAEIFVLAGVRSGQGRGGGAAYCATRGNNGAINFDGLLRHFQNSRRDDRLGGRFLFHFCFHYSLNSGIPACRYYEGSQAGDRAAYSMINMAFLFPGQGSQSTGMGRGLAEEYPAARRVFEEADHVLDFSISRLCFEGPDDELKKTENTQAALLTVSIAAYRVLEENGYRPALVAGHSLGEYSALVAANCLAFADALRLVRKRGRYMQEAVPEGVGTMAALLKLPGDRLAGVLAEAAQGEVVSAANLNSPDQVVIAGHARAVARAMEFAKAATPLINNWAARVIDRGEEARQGLYEQIPNPVRWADSMREMIRHGVERFVEVGPGAVLTGLARNIDPALRGVKFGEPGDLANVIELGREQTIA